MRSRCSSRSARRVKGISALRQLGGLLGNFRRRGRLGPRTCACVYAPACAGARGQYACVGCCEEKFWGWRCTGGSIRRRARVLPARLARHHNRRLRRPDALPGRQQRGAQNTVGGGQGGSIRGKRLRSTASKVGTSSQSASSTTRRSPGGNKEARKTLSAVDRGRIYPGESGLEYCQQGWHVITIGVFDDPTLSPGGNKEARKTLSAVDTQFALDNVPLQTERTAIKKLQHPFPDFSENPLWAVTFGAFLAPGSLSLGDHEIEQASTTPSSATRSSLHRSASSTAEFGRIVRASCPRARGGLMLPNCCWPGATKVCNGKCVDTRTDNANCGGCGTVCTPPLTCVNGMCSCPPGTRVSKFYFYGMLQHGRELRNLYRCPRKSRSSQMLPLDLRGLSALRGVTRMRR